MIILEKSTTLLERFKKIRKASESICQYLETEDFVIQPIDFVSPPKWHLAHTTWFFETIILAKFLKNYTVFHPSYNYIFNSYYESLGERVGREYRGTLSRPTVKDIMDYRAYVNGYMEILLEQTEASDVCDLIELGLQHEQQHQELLVYDIKYILFSNPLKPAYLGNPPRNIVEGSSIAPLEFVSYSGGVREIGFSGNGFAWDNETPVHKTYFEDFKIANRLITNGEYLQFMRDGGYQKFNLWLDDGWRWVNEKQVQSPLYWEHKDGEWQEFTLYGFLKLNPHLPVTHVSFYEASAFAQWAGRRLLTEAEWETTANANIDTISTGNFTDSGLFHPVAAEKQGLVGQLFGDVWEWTTTAYQPYPGYKPYPGPLGEYNGKFMINQMVLRGGSCATPQDHIRATYRNFFQPEHRWLFCGIRLGE